MMLRVKDESVTTNSRRGFSINFLFYLSFEFVIGAIISSFLVILNVIKSLLPKPPRDLSGDVVLCNKVKGIGPNHREKEQENAGATMAAYECNLLDRNAIREIAKKIEDEIGGIDVLVTCAGQSYQDIFDTATITLMSHYWTMLAFLPFMVQRDRAYIVGITPITSTQDVYLSSRAAIAGLMESLGQELSNRNSHLTFLTISPTIACSSTRQEEQAIAKEIVQAVRRGQCSISINWCSQMMYQISCVIYSAITTVSQWLHTQGCDYSF